MSPRDPLFTEAIAWIREVMTNAGLLPSITPRIAHPRVMGWLCGAVDAVLDHLDVPENETRTRRAEMYIGVMGEDSRAQMIALDAVTEHEAMRAGAPRRDYGETFLAALPAGRADLRAWMAGQPFEGL